jgi:hypothetical protein
MPDNILAPVVVLVAWTLVVMVWMVIVRMPAMRRAGIDVTKLTGGKPGGLDGLIEEKAQWPAHNYMHLVEQPTLFYAIALTLALLGAGTGINATLAWIYVGLRILHSLVQITFNRISVRFLVFLLSSIALIMLTFHAAMEVWHFDLH